MALDCAAFSTRIDFKSCKGKPNCAGLSVYSVIFPSFSSATNVSPVNEISSMPSAPCTTITCWLPKFCNTLASFKVKSLLNTPIICLFADAGLVSGPSRLNKVRTPSSRRTGAECFIAL